MKRSLIVGTVLILIVTIMLSSSIIPTAANDEKDMDEQTLSETMQPSYMTYCDYALMPELPKIKENGGAVDCFEEESKEEETYITYYTENDIVMLAELLYNECRGVDSVTEQACVVWTVLNRVNDSDGASIADIVTADGQFAYSHTPLLDDLLWLAEDVLSRWNAELNGETSVGAPV